ncbi:MAG: hypothetical protein Hals2KO_04940 [Halioglobus sp.]
MDLLPSQEQQQIVDAARHFLEGEFPLADALHLAEGEPRITREHLARIAELGWMGIGLEETQGGVGYGLSEEALLFVELGRSLLPPSILCSVLGARIAAAGTAQGKAAVMDEVLGTILSGRCKIAAAVPRTSTGASIGDVVSGEFMLYEAEDADFILLCDTAGAALVNRSALTSLTPVSCIDPTLSAATFTADSVEASAFVTTAQDDLYLRGALLCAALLLGIAEATLQRAVDYAKEREQYGKPIGSFQAIKHYCADMAVRCESLRAMLYYASVKLAQSDDSGRFDVHTCKALAVKYAQLNANTAVQIHGGMGYTQEMDIHLFVKRAQVLAGLFGGERQHLRGLLAQSRPD